jgi:hypothetical protein
MYHAKLPNLSCAMDARLAAAVAVAPAAVHFAAAAAAAGVSKDSQWRSTGLRS